MKNRNKILMVILPVLACFAFLPGAQATCVDGCDSLFGTFQGDDALIFNLTGNGNTAFGWRSLGANTDGSFNTGIGGGALVLNDGSSNTAVGAAALLLNTTGTENTAVGTDAMVFNDSGGFNAAVGGFALSNNISGSHNTAVGDLALGVVTAGDFNTALGANAGSDPDIGSNNIYIGDAGATGDQNIIAIGNISASGTPYGAMFVGGVVGAGIPTANAVPVYADQTTGQLGTVLVDAKGNPAARRLPRVKGAQPQATLNHKVEKLEATVAELRAQLKEQAEQIQKVSAQLEMSKPAAKVVVNKP
jgi:hypothetical protein